jgi:hypothetical protein
MKNIIIGVRLCLTFVLISPSIYANAQIFDPSTIWYQCGRDLQSNIPRSCSKSMLANSFVKNDTLFSTYPDLSQRIVIKQIRGKVYFDEELKYDFDLKVKDTMMIPIRKKNEYIPFVLDSSKTEFILDKNRKVMYLRAINANGSFTFYKQISGIGGTVYVSFEQPPLNWFEFDYYDNSGLLGDRLKDLSYIYIDNQLKQLSDCITCQKVVSTKEESFAEINIQPNPVIDFLNVNASISIKNYEIYNLAGQVLLSDTNKNSESRHSIDVTSLSKGIYFVRLNFSSGGSKVFKFLKE